jgi:hypothetical protein
MSTKQAVTIACRVLSVYFLVWLLSELTYLPQRVFSFLHYQGVLNQSGGRNFGRDLELISLAFLVLRIVVLFFAVQWFYRSGPAIRRYFITPSEGEISSD